ncbi:MAG: 50S ribosomal protein L21 [Patescibacteria group bacterium]|jgi:large subunit ribosomal protein L21|nr:50S ribosomal protein L21 [Patescibacteria group bacterium]
MSLAAIKTGGKQYLVKVGDKIKVEKLPGKVGDLVKLDTLLITDEKGENIQVGKPLLKIQTEAKIIKHDRGKRISVIKYKSKTRYHRTSSHRQEYTQIEITKI